MDEYNRVYEDYFVTIGIDTVRGIVYQTDNYAFSFYKNGNKKVECVKDTINDITNYFRYYESGVLMEEGFYFKNKAVGVWKNYNEDDILQATRHLN